MNIYAKDAIAKLKAEEKTGKFNVPAAAMKAAVREALEEFCEQDGEFAQAVVQGGPFADCMEAVARGVGRSISDLEAYRRAVQFYFPGAQIHMNMTIDLIGAADPERAAAAEADRTPRKGIILDLEDFL